MQHSLHRSKEWFAFVSERAVKDKQVRALIQDYMSARAKLNERLIELAAGHIDIEVARTSKGHTLTGGLIKQIKEYHDLHGVKTTEEQLCNDARTAGYEIIDVHGR